MLKYGQKQIFNHEYEENNNGCSLRDQTTTTELGVSDFCSLGSGGNFVFPVFNW